MPVPPKPFTLACQHCRWKHTYRPVSDVLNIPSLCPRCSQPDLTKRSPTKLEDLISRCIPKDTHWRIP